MFAGTINTDGTLRVQVTAAAENNTIARVVRLVEEAQEAGPDGAFHRPLRALLHAGCPHLRLPRRHPAAAPRRRALG